ncbi:CAP domain-containing protein [Clostridium merdae]|uniref:CAP domain-containing protein n=1 Tax=Clostridium merdae TaxID=1958780 RepID=UPI000A2672C8
MKLHRLYAAVIAVAVGSSVTASAVAFQQKAVPTAGKATSCPTSTVKNTSACSSNVEKAVNQALANAGKANTAVKGATGSNCNNTTVKAATGSNCNNTAVKAATGSNCNNTAVKAQTTSNCPKATSIPDLSAVLNQVSCKQAACANKASNGCAVAIPNCFQDLLERCGYSVPSKNNCSGSDCTQTGNNCSGSSCGSTSSQTPSKPSESSSSQSNSSTPSSSSSSSAPSSSAPSSSTPASSSSSVPSSSNGNSSTVSSTKPSDSLTFEERVVELVNQERAKVGLKALKMNLKLSDVARVKSQDMHDKNYFSHTSPTYGSPFDMMKQFGITYRTAGENIAMGYRTPEAVMEGWMNSPGHKANILNSSYTEIGVGYVASGNYWTQEFIG